MLSRRGAVLPAASFVTLFRIGPMQARSRAFPMPKMVCHNGPSRRNPGWMAWGLSLGIALLSGSVPGWAQGVDPTPGGGVSAAAYARAEAFLTANLEQRLFRGVVTPIFLEGDPFWYRVRTAEGESFYTVDPDRGVREPTSNLAPRASDGAARPSGVPSPDGRYIAFRKDQNLWVHDTRTGADRALTQDGVALYSYAADSQGWRRTEQPVLLWSPDSQKIATFRLDERGVGTMHLLRTAEPRAELVSWPYALPGDSIVPLLERVVVHVEEGRVVPLDTPPDFQRISSCCGLLRGTDWADVEWSSDGSRLAFVSVSRDYRTATLKVADPEEGSVRTVLEEHHPVFYESHILSGGRPNWRVLHDQGEVIWFSQREGWGHLYRYDLETGALRNRITAGEWNVLDLLRVDPISSTVVFTAVGREPGEDPYHRHLYRVSLDGSGWAHLTPAPGDHEVTITPSGAYFLDTASTVSSLPVTTLRRVRDGGWVMDLEVADGSALDALGWVPPEPFVVKGRDGQTDIHGILLRPSHFNPDARYPVVISIYPGPQVGSVGTRGFSLNRRGQAHALAELGFIVVLADGMGTPLRSKAFHAAAYGDLGDNGLLDQKAAVEALAANRPWMDLDRVGIYGHSGGGFATAAALLRHPEFFRVGVAGAGNHDNRGYTDYWGEKYQGPRMLGEDGLDSWENQANHLRAANLRGKLLLTYGTLDSNVHPNTTLLLVDALIRENRDFDLLVFPNRDHGYANEPYVLRRTWDYFITHLMGKTPPETYRIGG
jgi:dipeptidyl-peptidase 4